MSRPRFLADEDLKHVIVAAAVRFEPALEFVTVRSAGLSGHSDDRVLDFAAANAFLVVSHDVNTIPGPGTQNRKCVSMCKFCSCIAPAY